MTNPSDIDRELLLCPFCGSESKIRVTLVKNYEPHCGDVLCLGFISLNPIRITNREDAIDAWNTRAQPEWRDISTAPKDGTFVLTCMPFACPSVSAWQTYFDISRFGKDPETFMTEDGFIMYWVEVEYQPTHWMPLPKAPS